MDGMDADNLSHAANSNIQVPLLKKRTQKGEGRKTRINSIGTNRCKYVSPTGQDIASGGCTRPLLLLDMSNSTS